MTSRSRLRGSRQDGKQGAQGILCQKKPGIMPKQGSTRQSQIDAACFEQGKCILVHSVEIATFMVMPEQEKQVLGILVVL